jgi:hypothetical protein
MQKGHWHLRLDLFDSKSSPILPCAILDLGGNQKYFRIKGGFYGQMSLGEMLAYPKVKFLYCRTSQSS